jgi:outer membrane protein assembly factor BamE (lipoprotein component of BamABCDE complex)
VQAAIRAGKVSPGMTKKQVIVALGYPRMDLTPSIEASRWSYVAESDEKFVLVWDDEERLRTVEATPELHALLVQAP